MRCFLSLVFGLIMWAGCVTPQTRTGLRYVALDEPQPTWPTRQFGLMHLVNGFPVYGLEQFPPAPYEVKGILFVAGLSPTVNSRAEQQVVERARQEGGEAAMLCKHELPNGRLASEETDYLIIQFKTNALATVLDRINVYLALTPGSTNTSTPAELEQAAREREQFEGLKERLLRQSQAR